MIISSRQWVNKKLQHFASLISLLPLTPLITLFLFIVYPPGLVSMVLYSLGSNHIFHLEILSSILKDLNQHLSPFNKEFLKGPSWVLFSSSFILLLSVPSSLIPWLNIISTLMTLNFSFLLLLWNLYKIALILKIPLILFQHGCQLTFCHSISLKLNFYSLVFLSRLQKSLNPLLSCPPMSLLLQFNLHVILVSFLTPHSLCLTIFPLCLNFVS